MRLHYNTLNIPATDRVKLEVFVNTRNSLTSMANAMNAPTEILNHISSMMDLSVWSKISKLSTIRFPASNSKVLECEIYFLSDLNQYKPSNPSVNGNTAKIIHGCMWKIISMGLCSPSFDFCIISWAKDQRIPLESDAKRRNENPSVSKWVDLYVNRKSPPEIMITIAARDQLCV